MNVVTKNPILINTDADVFSSLDGTSTKEEILAAQKIINQLISVENMGKPFSDWKRLVKEDGIWTPHTSAAYANRKTKVDEELAKVKAMFMSVARTPTQAQTPPPPIAPLQTNEVSEKITKMSKTAIIAISVTGVVLVGLGIWYLVKKK